MSKKYSKSSKIKSVSGNVDSLDQVENQNRTDEFDDNLPINYEEDFCAMCKKGNKDGKLLTAEINELSRWRDKSNDDDDDNDSVDDDGDDYNNTRQTDNPLSKTILNSGQSKDNIAKRKALKKYLDPDIVWFSKYSIALGKRRVFVHYYCALYSPQTVFDGLEWQNVRREVIRSASLNCYACQTRGATLGCADKRCPYICHIPCAIKIGANTGFLKRSSKFLCPTHYADKKKLQVELDLVASRDVTKGRECIPINVVNALDCDESATAFCQPCMPIASSLSLKSDSNSNSNNNSNKSISSLFNFAYISNNLDSDDVVATCQNVERIECCDCEGLCNDVDKCACLKQQRNYTNQGILIHAKSKIPIFECNMRCCCSSRRCTNRVVEQGIKFQFEVFRGQNNNTTTSTPVSNITTGPLSSSLTTHKQKKQKLSLNQLYWGLRTLQSIPQGCLICEVKGQYVTGASLLNIQRVPPTMITDANGTNSHEIEASDDQQDGNNSKPRTVSQEFIAQLKRIELYRHSSSVSSSLSIFPIQYWELPIFTVDSLYSYALQNNQSKTVKNSSSSGSSSGITGTSGNFDNTSRDPLVDDSSKYLILELFFDKQIFLDTRCYGNISRFIRQKFLTSSSDNSNSINSSATNTAGPNVNNIHAISSINRNVCILNRRIVLNDRNDTRYPKLAIFAAVDISADTELIL